jgi:hypothetical protein
MLFSSIFPANQEEEEESEEKQTTVANKEKLDEVIVIGTSPCWWCSHRFITNLKQPQKNQSLCLSLTLSATNRNINYVYIIAGAGLLEIGIGKRETGRVPWPWLVSK